MDHEVHYNIDVKRSWREYAEAMHLEKHRPRDQRHSRENGRIEPFQMAHLGNAFSLLGDINQFASFGERGSNGVFDEHVDPGRHELLGNGKMIDGRHCHRCSVDLSLELDKRVEGCGCKLFRCHTCAGGILINNSDQLHAAAFLFQLTVNSSVISSKDAASNHADPNVRGLNAHSKNRNLKMCHTAATPSRQVIFLPSS